MLARKLVIKQTTEIFACNFYEYLISSLYYAIHHHLWLWNPVWELAASLGGHLIYLYIW